LEKFKLIIPDLIEGWYCRVWAVLMFCVFASAFSGLVVFSLDSSYNSNRLDWNMFFTIQDEVKYPAFYFRTERNGLNDPTFLRANCSLDLGRTRLPLQLQQCGGEFKNFTGRCLLSPNTEEVNRANRRDGTGMIFCQFQMQVTPSLNSQDEILLFGIDGESREFRTFRHSYLFPNNMTHIGLERIEIRPMFRPVEYNWIKTVNYLSSDHSPGFYHVGVQIDSFRQIHYVQGNDDPGFVAVGDIGGFTYFLLLIHIVLMFFVGFCLPNKSKFLAASQ